MLDLLLAFTADCAAHVIGLDALHGQVLHIEGSDVVSQDFQSDRTYPPFLSDVEPLQYWYAPDRLLWASDYIQDATAPTMYLDEVCHAVERVHRTPERAGAEHLPITPWAKLRAFAKCGP